MSVPVGSLVQFNVFSECNGQKAISTFGFRVTAASASGSNADEANDFMDQEASGGVGTYSGLLAACMSESAVITSVSFQSIYPTRYARYGKEVTIPGTRLGDCHAQNVAAVLLRRGDQGRRRDVSTLHVPFLSTTDLDEGKIVPALQAAVEAVGTKLLGTLTIVAGGGQYAPAILSPFKYPGTPSVFITETASYPTVRTMRSRTIGRGI